MKSLSVPVEESESFRQESEACMRMFEKWNEVEQVRTSLCVADCTAGCLCLDDCTAGCLGEPDGCAGCLRIDDCSAGCLRVS